MSANPAAEQKRDQGHVIYCHLCGLEEMAGDQIGHAVTQLDLVLGQGADQRVERLGPGEAWHVSPGTVHRFRAVTDCLLFEVSTPELEDVVRLEDDYGREGTSDGPGS